MGAEVALRGDDARKLSLVLRKVEGDEIEIVDSSGRAFVATFFPRDGSATARLERELTAPPERRIEIILAQAIPKASKMDYVVEKATELGVTRIVPLVTERSTAAFTREGKTERWRRLARSAAQQCGRRDVPAIDETSSWEAFCAGLGAFDRALVPWELADPVPLRERLPALVEGERSVAIAVGPEGGLTHTEVERATAAGATAISLGRRILRTETAGLVVCSLVRYAAGDL